MHAATSVTPPGAAALHDEHASSLRRHLQHCRAARSRWFGAAAWAERAHGVVAPRFVTTVAAVSLVLALGCGWL